MSDLPNEYTQVERPFIEQLQAMGWQHLEGDTTVPYLTERQSFREVLLTDRLRQAVRRINVGDDGQPWLDDRRITEGIQELQRVSGHKLMEANQAATKLLLAGVTVEGDPDRHGGREQTIRFFDFDHPENNDFLVINQFRVDPPWAVADKDFIIPDLVLFVNGIPLVVVECKSPAATGPMLEAITQLLRYSNQREWVTEEEGAERLFHTNQFMVATFRDEARAGTIGASYEHYLEWKDTSPVPSAQVAANLGVERLNSQQTLVAGMLRPSHLLDLIRNFTLFQQIGGATIKIVARYQQFRAVYEAIRRLQRGQTRRQHGDTDQRGGIIWHTQGSGKSLTMVFLVRKLRTLPDLRRFKVVLVTDRTDLEKQLSDTAVLTGETPHRADRTDRLKELLRQPGADLVFAMIQKYQERETEGEGDEDEAEGETEGNAVRPRRAAEERATYQVGGRAQRIPAPPEELFPVLNESEEILVLVDEAHRSQASALHANLLRALPNCARIGFTGTPIMVGDRLRTQRIFGDFIDRYTIRQSEADGATVPILYEGRTDEGDVADGHDLDTLFENMFRERTPKQLEAIQAKYATKGNVLEAEKLIAAKAADMLRHYVENVLPHGLKAQVVGGSRRAAVRYQAALAAAHRELLVRLETLDPALLTLSQELQEKLDSNQQYLLRSAAHLDTIRRLEFAAVISGGGNDEGDWKEWTDGHKQDVRIERFKKPLVHQDPTRQDGLAFLCVKSMLLTGFDTPVEQVLYLDRFMQGHELLQAIARVNRTAAHKAAGLVVDYCGIGGKLKEALAVYSADDIDGALVNLKDELPKLEDRHRRVGAVFHDRGIPDIADIEACVELLRDLRIRAEFLLTLKQFLATLDIVLPRPEGLPYVRDAKILGFINKAAANRYRDSDLDLIVKGAEQKVRRLIDDYIVSHGVDPKVPPISILDADFERAVDTRPTNRAKASEMEHAARHHITEHYGEDPAYYGKLSERLEEILQAFHDRWEELVHALREFTRDVRQGRPADESGLDPRTQAPFLGILAEEISPGGRMPKDQLAKMAGLTVEMVDHIRQEIRAVDFWRSMHAQNVLRGWVIAFLDDHDLILFSRQEATADSIVQLARALHFRLTA